MNFTPFMLLPFDSLPRLIGFENSYSQLFPALLVYSPLVFLIALFMPHKFRRIKSIEWIIISTIIIYLILLTFFVHLVPNIEQYNFTFSSFIRQFIALLAGLLIYLSFRFFNVSQKLMIKHITIGTLMTVPIVLYQIFIGIDGFFRIKGFSTEPSHFGHFLVFAALPAVLMDELKSFKNKLLFFYVNLCVLLTFSITTYFSVLLLYLFWGYMHYGFKVFKYFTFIIFIVPVVFLSINYFDYEYVMTNLSFFLSIEAFELGLQSSASLTDRFYSVWIPLKSLFSFNIIFGYGVAGDYFVLKDLMPSQAYELISSVRSGDVGISSFFGKIVIWGGWFLSTAFFLISIHLYQNAPKKIRIFALPVLISSFFSMGSLVYPYIWLWLAILKNAQDESQ